MGKINLSLKQGSPKGVGGTNPYPPWGRSAKFTKLAKSTLFSNFFSVNLIQNVLNKIMVRMV